MPTDQRIIQKLLDHRPRPATYVKGRSVESLLDEIKMVSGVEYKPITVPRPWQLEALTFALSTGRNLMFVKMRLGKALKSDWLVSTPSGWREIRHLSIGDLVYGPDGKTTKVLGVYPQGMRPMYRVTFSDDAETICDEDHLWAVATPMTRWKKEPWQVKTIKEIASAPLLNPHSKGFVNFTPMPEPVEFPGALLEIDPYTLGVYLGDGTSTQGTPSITTDDEIISDYLVLPCGVLTTKYCAVSDNVSSYGIRAGSGHKNSFSRSLKLFGLYGKKSNEKFIPRKYLHASVSQRVSLLQGLMDTDGTILKRKNMQYGSTSLQLAKDVQELVRSLGGICRINQKKTHYTKHDVRIPCLDYYWMSIRLPASIGCPFKLKRKAEKWHPTEKFLPQRAIKSITRVEDADATCIKVDRADGLFVIRDYVVTHNTKFFLDWADHMRRAGWWRPDKKALVIVPRPVVLSVWEIQVKEHSRLKVATATNENELRDALWSDADVIVVSWFTLQTIFTKKRIRTAKTPARSKALVPDYESLQAFAKNFEIVCIDEIHLCKNPNSLRFKIAVPLAMEARYFTGLTGTPHGRNPFDLWAQTYLVDGGALFGRTMYFFKEAFGKSKYSHFSKTKTEMVFNKEIVPVIEEKLSSIALSYGWDGNIETREPIANIVKISMTRDQKKLYQQVIDQLIETKPDNYQEIDAVFVRLRQVSSGYLPVRMDDGSTVIYNTPKSPKIEWLDELFDEMPEDVPCLLYYEFTHTGKAVADLLEKRGIPFRWLWSGTKDKAGAVRDFQSGKVNVLLVNNGSGDVAIELSRADYLCFIESPVSPTVRQQIEARPQSASKRPLVIDDLVVAPVDEKILNYVKQGKMLLAKIVYADETRGRFKKKRT